MTGGPELLARTQYRYLKNQEGYLSNIVSALVTEDWMSVVSQCTTDSWKEALAATLTHSKEQMPQLCDRLGERLQEEGDSDSATIQNAILCFICAGNVEKLVESWPILNQDEIIELQDLVEIVVLLQKALELQGRSVGASGKLADLLSRYAGLLAAQGALNSALAYLGPSEDPQLIDLRERLYYSLGYKQAYATRASQAQNTYGQQSRASFNQPRASIPNSYGQMPSQPQQTFTNNFVPQPTFGNQPSQPWLPQQPQPPQNTWNSPPQNAPQAPLVPTMPPVGPPPPVAMSQPPRPSSVGSQGKI